MFQVSLFICVSIDWLFNTGFNCIPIILWWHCTYPCFHGVLLTLSQTTNFGPFHTERVCRWHFQIWLKWQKVFRTGRKHCVKRRNCLVWAISPFVFKRLVLQTYKNQGLLWKGLTSTLHNILSKPLAAFPCNHCRNIGQRIEGNESCRNDYHQSFKRMLCKLRVEPVTSFSQVRYAIDWAMGLGTSFVFWSANRKVVLSHLFLSYKNNFTADHFKNCNIIFVYFMLSAVWSWSKLTLNAIEVQLESITYIIAIPLVAVCHNTSIWVLTLS